MNTDNQDSSRTPVRSGERGNDLINTTRQTLSRLSARWGFALVASTAFALACAADLDGEASDYPSAYLPAGGAPGQAGNTGLPTAGSGDAPGSAGGPSTAIPPDPACLSDVLSNNTCLSCHGSEQISNILGGGLSFEGGSLGTRLSKTVAKYQGVQDPGNCVQGALIINPADPTSSVLLRKVKGQQSCGGAMPSAPGLTGAALQCIEEWVMKFGP